MKRGAQTKFPPVAETFRESDPVVLAGSTDNKFRALTSGVSEYRDSHESPTRQRLARMKSMKLRPRSSR